MIIIIFMVTLNKLVINAHHQYNGINNEYTDRRGELLNSRHHHLMNNLKPASVEQRRVNETPKVYNHPFKKLHPYQDLFNSEKLRANHKNPQKKELWKLSPRNFRQALYRRNNHFISKNNVKNTGLHPIEKIKNKHMRSNIPILKSDFILPVTNAKVLRTVLNKKSKPFHSFRGSLIANNFRKLHPNLKVKRFNAVRPRKTEKMVKNNLPRKRKSLFEPFDFGQTIYLELFFISMAMMTLLIAFVTTVTLCWKNKFRAPDGSHRFSKRNSESTIGSVMLHDHTSDDIPSPNLSKSESDIWRSLVTNEIDAEGDRVAKRMKLERWMHQKCKCCPEDKANLKNKQKFLRQCKLLDDQSEDNKETVSDSNIPLVPNPRLSPTSGPPVETPFPGTSKQTIPIGDSRYPVTGNPSDGPNSLRTFDSHIKVTQEAKDKKDRRRSRSRKHKDKESRDSKNKYSSEPFGVYDKIHKSRKY